MKCNRKAEALLIRGGEPLWISEDLEKFSQPIMYDIFGGDDDRL